MNFRYVIGLFLLAFFFGRQVSGNDSVVSSIPLPNLSSSAQIIAPSEIQSGEYVPIAIKILNSSGEIDATLTGDYTLSAGGATLQSSSIKIVRGVGAVLTRINATSSFSLGVIGFAGSKSIGVNNSPSSTNRSGTLSSDETWSSSQIYHITNDLFVPSGRKLTINPGTRVYLDKDVNVLVDGAIQVAGDVNNPVLFIASVHGDEWGGIELDGGNQNSSLSFLMLSEGGGDSNRTFGHSNSQPVIFGDQTTLNLDHVFFIDNKGKAIGTNECTNIITDCVFFRCDTGAEFRYSNTNISSTYVMQIPDGDGSIDDNDNDALYFWNQKSSGPQRSTVSNCVVYMTEDDGLDFNSQARVDIYNCFITQIYDKGLSGGNASDLKCVGNIVTHCSGGVGSKDHSTVAFENGTLYANDIGLLGYTKNVDQGGGYITAKNVIISQSVASPVSEDSDSDVQVSYSISDTDPISGTGNLTGNPRMVNPSGGDFSLLEGSPAIDAGDPTSPHDPDGTRADMGAIYYPQSTNVVPLVISEINYMPKFDGVENTSYEFVELYNPNSETVNLAGYRFTAGFSYTFPAGSQINSHAYLIVASSSTIWSGSGIDHYQWSSGSLNNLGEVIRLENQEGGVVAEVTYGIDGNWPQPSQLYNFPIELGSITAAYTDGSSWKVSLQYGGTPGKANIREAVSQLYINEFIAKSGASDLDDQGEISDWIEIYNASAEPVNLAGLDISDLFTDPGQFRISTDNPDLTTVPSLGYVLLWPDAQPFQGVQHLIFELRHAGEEIILSQVVNGSRVTIDQLTYDLQSENVSWGRYPDGSENFRFLDPPTPGAANQAGVEYPIENIFINEFVAKFGTLYPDEHGIYSDWIEVYNAGNESVDLGGLYFTDDLSVPDKVRVPSGYPAQTTVSAHGFLVLRADIDPGAGPLHLDFQLASAGEQVGIFQKLNGQLRVVDTVTYPHQDLDVSYGRATDGGLPWRKFWTPTPNSTNSATAGLGQISQSNIGFSIYPNPFSEWVTIELAMDREEPVKVEVFDQVGRKVAESTHDPVMVPAGNWIWTWEGNDESGSPLPLGVYWIRIQMNELIFSGRVIRL